MVSDSMKHFGLLCRQVTAEPSLTIKQEIIRGFLSRFTGDTGLLLKLLLPKYAQRVYYIQDKQLLRVLSLVLRVDEAALRDKLNSNGCIAETACAYFHPTVAVDSDGWCGMTLTDFDAFLNSMAVATVETERVPLLQHFFQVACSNVVYYFFREIKQDLRLGAGLRVVLGGLHPSAYTVFQNCANVQEVVRRIQASTAVRAPASAATGSGSASAALDAVDGDDDDENSRGDGVAGGVNTAISIGIPLAPMLAAPARSIAQIVAKCPNGAFSEVKYDGERIQIHKRGSKLTFFARSLRPMRADKFAGLEPFILQAIKADDCVLDGEILMVDVRTSVPLPFGTLGKHRRTQFSSACPCVFLFDVLFSNGRSLLKAPLEERREELKKNVQFIRNRVMFSELCLIEGRPEQREALLHQHLQRAIAEGLEGLVIKDRKSVYEPRARHWLKIKKDYLDGLADSADLLVLGAWFGSGNKGGQLSTFLMGCVDPSVSPGGPGRFKTVCKVGNGLNDNQISAISAAYTTRMMSTAASRDGQRGVPAWLDCPSCHLPDMVLRDPATADVMEVIGAELLVTKTHTSGISVRFPRILKMRTDKTVDTATTLRELQQLFRTSKEKLSSAGVDTSLQLADSYTVMPEEEDSSASGPPDTFHTTSSGQAARTPTPPPRSSSLLSSPERSRRTAPAAVTCVAMGDVTAPSIPSTESFVIFHSVAVQGRWSVRGVMRRISEAYGPSAGKAYDQAAASSVLGQVIYAEVGPVSRPGRVFVASAVAQRTAPPGQVPPVDQRALEKALLNAATYAQRNCASLHVVIPAAETQVQVPPLLELFDGLCARFDVPITVYGAPPHSTSARQAAAPQAAAPRIDRGGNSSGPARTLPPPPPPPPPRPATPPAPAEDDEDEIEDELAAPALAASSFCADAPLRFSRGRGRRYALLRDVVAQIVHSPSDDGAAAAAGDAQALLELMQGRCVALSDRYDAAVPCTHALVVGDAPVPPLGGAKRHSVFVLSAEWVRDCFHDGVRYSECLYKLGSARPTAHLLDGQCLLFSAALLLKDAHRWRRLAVLLGATVHQSWHVVGQRTSFALTDAWDDECAEVYRLGGWVVHCQWLEDCAMAAAVLPLDAYVFSPATDGQLSSSKGARRPLAGKSVCLWPNVDIAALPSNPVASLCGDELGATLVASPADADHVLLMMDTAAERQRAAAAVGTNEHKLVNMEWLRRCAAAGEYQTPTSLPPLRSGESPKHAHEAVCEDGEAVETASRETSSTASDSSLEDA
ncbi:putative DNA ligase [Leptomonas pyrrhocoris]|uniref:DNA ligase n=1 Tax=Leptomonas pyrrhocoris TaxID=157538 RepID=A0A0N0DSM7_LEPPY|nr:putative DNA ligase [Leptomonas pyrrhocoris]XP_015654270.1 putative DNA ligase [Leptomonas pyrrhocoris]KPA75830.1 putative DNA ligase [Leptomonas pyrrhocoris]KPA75831.1 putative DNA ligase [Leptomonas pyrrhocoris]|eukprot:XP_015654269.1 putative DNA ligase [Leptomonas pyrrhocoris]